jgi:NADH:ubiquinone oxidoreductase subunit F (NADH-binding)
LCRVGDREHARAVEGAILSANPHAVLEGMAIVAHALDASTCRVCLLPTSWRFADGLSGEVAQARERGFFDHRSEVGATACDVSVITSAEDACDGRLARHAAAVTAWQATTAGRRVVASGHVEDFAAIPGLVSLGDAGAGMSSTGAAVSIVSLAGAVARAGVLEVPAATTLRELLFTAGGGPIAGRGLKAVNVDGARGCCLPADELDRTIADCGVGAAGRPIGAHSLLALDDTTCMVDLARGLARGAEDRSCGACAPCRLGAKRLHETLDRVCALGGRKGDVDLVVELAEGIADGAACDSGRTACRALLETVARFRDEFDAHIAGGQCPAGRCGAQP